MVDVLHILDIAGVPSIISHYYNKLNMGKSKLIYNEKNSFSYSISKFYEGQSFKKFHRLLLNGLVESLKYDLVHIHGAEILIPFFKIFGRKVVLHYHGSDIMEPGRSTSKWRIFCRSMADLIIFNADYMKPKIITSKKVRIEFLSNPIDIEHFSSRNEKKYGCLSIVSSNLDKEKTIQKIKKIENADIIDLDIQQIPYRFMPNVLSKYKVYADIKIMPWGQRLKTLSTTALQALSCGCDVFFNDKLIDTFPKENDPYNYIEKLNHFYEEILYKKNN